MAQLDWLIVDPSNDTTGSTDVANLAQAINDVYLSGGGEIHLREADYYWSSDVPCKDGVSVYGIRPKLAFGSNCPDLNFTASGGTTIRATTTGLSGFTGNKTPNPGVELEPISNICIKNLVLKGFAYPLDFGATEQLGMGFGEFDVIIDGTGTDNVTVQTEIAGRFINCQQVKFPGFSAYNVNNGIQQVNDHTGCSSGNTTWFKPYIYLNPTTTPYATATITANTVGQYTQIDFDEAIDFEIGDIAQLKNVTGANASFLNRVHKVASVISPTSITVDADLRGKVVNNDGTICKGRFGIMCKNTGAQPLNHVTFFSPQVNCFLPSEQAEGVVNIAVMGATTGNCNAISFYATDTEGKTDHHIYLDGLSNSILDIATVNENPTQKHLRIWNSAAITVVSASQDLDVDIGDTTLSGGGTAGDGTININVTGTIASLGSTSRKPNGLYYNVATSKQQICASSVVDALEFDLATSSFGPPLAASTWATPRLMTKSTSVTTFSATATIPSSRMGIWRCTNAADGTATLPVIGTGTGQVPVGSIVAFNKVSGAGLVTIAAGAANTIAGAATYTAISNTVGKSVFLMADGVTDWVIMGQN